MSIASELADANQALADAKAMIVEKGGTVGDTGLVGLSDEISSIPSGGGTLDSYGSIKYLDGGVERSVELATEMDFEELTLGGSSDTLTINGTQVVKGNITEVVVADGVIYLPDYFLLNCNQLTTVTLPDSVQYIGRRVLYGCSVLNTPVNLKNIRRVGEYFMYGCSAFNQPISLPNVEYISQSLMASCSSFNSSITINDACMVIESGFMQDCWTFAQPFVIPSGLLTSTLVNQNPATSFMYRCRRFTGPLVCNGPVSSIKIPTDNNSLATSGQSDDIYTTGVTLTGPYAADWKAALPDRSSSPYRKLILGS